MEPHKGTELNNVKETWQQNEEQPAAGSSNNTGKDEPAAVSKDLQQTIKEEAAEYDQANKEERILDGDRATIRDKDRED
jgi:hypothetical protein